MNPSLAFMERAAEALELPLRNSWEANLIPHAADLDPLRPSPCASSRSASYSTGSRTLSFASSTLSSKKRDARSPMPDFDILEEIANVVTIAIGKRIRELPRLEKQYGSGRWRKMKGEAKIRLTNGRVVRAELHWYEAHGIGRKEFKRKRYLV